MLPLTLRRNDGVYILQRLADGDCCTVVGLSNTGKSYLLRALARREVRQRLLGGKPDSDVFVYIDFNLMLEATEQGFYELILRCLMEELMSLTPPPEFLGRLQSAYHTLVAPPSAFQISLSFSEGLTAVCQGLPLMPVPSQALSEASPERSRKVEGVAEGREELTRPSSNLVLLFDEFDEPFEQIDGRAFLNLRALKDKYRQRLNFVTATNRRLSSIRRGRDVDEFVELFDPFTRFLGPLEQTDTDQIIAWIARQEGYTFDDEDRAFLYHHADGHLGMLLAVCRALGEVTGEPVRDPGQDWLIHRQVRERLDGDFNVQGECRKLWDDLTEVQQDTLIAIVGAESDVDQRVLDSLLNKGLIRDREGLLFSPVFEGFVRRQRLTRRRRHEGVRVDVESGSVWVDGKQTPILTDLEYRLLLLLYGRLNKICDKYQIVEEVWGEDYIEQVDDARIDKLLSRLRAKVEPDPRNPRYIVTVRGRGYKLVSP